MRFGDGIRAVRKYLHVVGLRLLRFMFPLSPRLEMTGMVSSPKLGFGCSQGAESSDVFMAVRPEWLDQLRPEHLRGVVSGLQQVYSHTNAGRFPGEEQKVLVGLG